MPSITPCVWFDGRVEEALDLKHPAAPCRRASAVPR